MAAQAVAAPLYECSIQGAFGDDLIAQVLERLRGLCSNETPLHYRELAYKSILGAQPSEMRVRCYFTNAETKWTLRNSSVMSREKMNATIKNVVDVEVSSNICSFLEYMSYKHDYEYFMKGYKFTAQRTLTITVTQVKKSEKGHQDPSDFFGKVWLVDIICTATDETLQQACDQIHTFAEYMLPFVEVAKIDARTLTEKAQPQAPTLTTLTPTSPRYNMPAGGGFPGWNAKKDPKRR